MKEPLQGRAKTDPPAPGAGATGQPAPRRAFVREQSPAFRRIFADAEPVLEVRTVTVHDTGIGRDAGFANDRELVDAAAAERTNMAPVERELAERVDREVDRRAIEGDAFPSPEGW
jgi:hypothetical protein